jgi:hypothetical protein
MSGLTDPATDLTAISVRPGQSWCPIWPPTGHDGHNGRVFVGKRWLRGRARWSRCARPAHPIQQVRDALADTRVGVLREPAPHRPIRLAGCSGSGSTQCPGRHSLCPAPVISPPDGLQSEAIMRLAVPSRVLRSAFSEPAPGRSLPGAGGQQPGRTVTPSPSAARRPVTGPQPPHRGLHR